MRCTCKPFIWYRTALFSKRYSYSKGGTYCHHHVRVLSAKRLLFSAGVYAFVFILSCDDWCFCYSSRIGVAFTHAILERIRSVLCPTEISASVRSCSKVSGSLVTFCQTFLRNFDNVSAGGNSNSNLTIDTVTWIEVIWIEVTSSSRTPRRQSTCVHVKIMKTGKEMGYFVYGGHSFTSVLYLHVVVQCLKIYAEFGCGIYLPMWWNCGVVRSPLTTRTGETSNGSCRMIRFA